MTLDDRDVYRCKVAAAVAGLTSISVQFPSLSWRTSSKSVQTYTGKHKGGTVNPFLEIHIWFTIIFYQDFFFKKALLGPKNSWWSYRYHKSQHDKDKTEPDLHLWKGRVICFPLRQASNQKRTVSTSDEMKETSQNLLQLESHHYRRL